MDYVKTVRGRHRQRGEKRKEIIRTETNDVTQKMEGHTTRYIRKRVKEKVEKGKAKQESKKKRPGKGPGRKGKKIFGTGDKDEVISVGWMRGNAVRSRQPPPP